MSHASINFMLDTHISDFGFEEASPPLITQSQAMYNSGPSPKFSDASFVIDTGSRLIPTSEVTLVNLATEKVFTEVNCLLDTLLRHTVSDLKQVVQVDILEVLLGSTNSPR